MDGEQTPVAEDGGRAPEKHTVEGSGDLAAPATVGCMGAFLAAVPAYVAYQFGGTAVLVPAAALSGCVLGWLIGITLDADLDAGPLGLGSSMLGAGVGAFLISALYQEWLWLPVMLVLLYTAAALVILITVPARQLRVRLRTPAIVWLFPLLGTMVWAAAWLPHICAPEPSFEVAIDGLHADLPPGPLTRDPDASGAGQRYVGGTGPYGSSLWVVPGQGIVLVRIHRGDAWSIYGIGPGMRVSTAAERLRAYGFWGEVSPWCDLEDILDGGGVAEFRRGSHTVDVYYDEWRRLSSVDAEDIDDRYMEIMH